MLWTAADTRASLLSSDMCCTVSEYDLLAVTVDGGATWTELRITRVCLPLLGERSIGYIGPLQGVFCIGECPLWNGSPNGAQDSEICSAVYSSES